MTPAGARLVQCRIDKFNLAYGVEISHEQEVDLADAHRMVREFNHPLRYVIAGAPHRLEVKGTAEMPYRFRNDDGVVLAGGKRKGLNVRVEFDAVYLATRSPEALVARGHELATRIAGAEPALERVMRLDLCADAVGVDFCAEDVEAFVTRAKRGVTFHPRRVHSKRSKAGRVCTGIWIGLGHDISVRLYDKTEELRTQCVDDHEKRRLEEEAFRRAGWDGKSPVWRLEVQLRGKLLDDLGLRDPAQAILRLDAVWHRVFGTPAQHSKNTYCRLVLPGSATRRERALTDPRWELFQGADFRNTSKDAAERRAGARGNANAHHLLGMSRSALASRGLLRSFPGDTDPLVVLQADLDAVRDFVSADRTALDAHCQKREAVIARFASADDGPVAPEGRGIRAIDVWEGFDEVLTG